MGKEKMSVSVGEKVEPIDVSLPYEDHVTKFRSQIGLNRKKTLRTIWEMGAFVNVLKGTKVYGGKTVEAFVESMGDEAVSMKEIYKWAQFSERYQPEQVNRLLGLSNIGWGVVSNLIRVKSEQARTMIEDKIDSGEITPGKLQDVVSELNKVSVTEPGSGGVLRPLKGSSGEEKINPAAPFRKINNLLETVLTCRIPCDKGIQDLALIADSGDKYDKAAEVMERFQALASEIIKDLKELSDTLDKTI